MNVWEILSLIEIFSPNSFEARRSAPVLAQMPVDQIWRRGIAVATTAAAECECPALPAPSDTTNLLAYVCHVSIVMHGGGAGWEGRVGVGRRVGQSVRRPIIMPNSGLYPIRALHHTQRKNWKNPHSDSLRRTKKLWSRVTSLK